MGPVFGDMLKFLGSAPHGAVHAQVRVGKIVYTWDLRSNSSPLLTRSVLHQRQSLLIPVRVCQIKPTWIKMLQKAREEPNLATSTVDSITKDWLSLYGCNESVSKFPSFDKVNELIKKWQWYPSLTSFFTSYSPSEPPSSLIVFRISFS